MALIDNLISWWELNEASGTRYDSHGGYHATDVNTVGSTTGKKGNAASFVAANLEQLEVANDTVFQPAIGNPFTIAFWLRPSAAAVATTACRPVGKLGPSGQEWMVTIRATGIRFQCAGGFADTSLGLLSAGTWVHIVCHYKGASGANTLEVAINGALAGSGATGTPFGNVGPVRFGWGGFGTRYDNDLDEIGFWNRSLLSTEWAELYNSGNGVSYADIAPPPPDPAIGSGIAQAIARSSGSGYTLHGGGGKSRAIATSAGSGYTARTGSGAAQAIAASIGSGYTLRSGYGPAPAVARSEGSGYTQRKGSGIGQAIADSHGAGYVLRSGSGTSPAVADSAGTGYTSRYGSGPAPAIADSHATGYTARTGSGPAPAIASSQGTGYVRRTGSGRAPAIAWSRGHGYTARGGSGLARAIARSQGSGYTLRGGFGAARAFARSTGHGIAPGPTPMPTRHQGVRLRLRLPTRLQNRL